MIVGGTNADTVIATVPWGVIVHDLEFRVRLWNPAAERVFGWRATTTLGQACPILASPNGSRLKEALADARLRGASLSLDFHGHRADHSVLSARLHVAPLCGEGGQTTGTLTTVEDAEPAVRPVAAAVDPLRWYIDNAIDAMLLLDGGGRILDSNPAAQRILGFAPEELRQFSLWEAVEEGGGGRERARQLLTPSPTASPVRVQVPLRTKDQRPLLADLSAVTLGPDRILSAIRDVTAQRQTEHDLRLYERAFESSGEAIVITDAKNRITTANPAFSTITGYPLAEVMGRNPSFLSSGRHDREFYNRMWEAISATHHWQGEIWNRRRNGQVYPEWLRIDALRDGDGQVTNYVAVFSDITELKVTEARASFLAHHDSLTGLPNRVLMLDRLTQALAGAQRDARKVGVLVIDLDGFKTINGSLGHQVGDVVLQVVSTRLRAVVRAVDTVARTGGDEFAIILPGLNNAEDVLPVVSKLIAAVAEPVRVDGQEIHTAPSVGISVYPEDGQDSTTLIRNADAAMYGAKDAGRATHRFFTADMNTRAVERLRLLDALHHAIERQEFTLHYQPQWSIRGRKMIGAEALLRWSHPTLGQVSPARFIPLAEESGLIRPIGEWVLQQACAQAQRWSQGPLGPLPVAVNLSPAQFHHPDLFGVVTRSLEQSGLPPHLLDLELTEGALMRDAALAATVLRRLRDLGAQVSIDDFGSGYSSLNSLRHLPITRLKIDHAFIRDLETDANDVEIIRAIVALGHHLKLKVLAEGVETRQQLDALAGVNCDEVQGYLLARPMLPAAVDRLRLEPAVM